MRLGSNRPGHPQVCPESWGYGGILKNYSLQMWPPLQRNSLALTSNHTRSSLGKILTPLSLQNHSRPRRNQLCPVRNHHAVEVHVRYPRTELCRWSCARRFVFALLRSRSDLRDQVSLVLWIQYHGFSCITRALCNILSRSEVSEEAGHTIGSIRQQEA